MTTTRREWMKVAAVAGGALSLPPALVGCERAISRVTKEFGQTIPDRVSVACGSEIDPSFHLLSRASYGVWPGDLDCVRAMTAEAWIEEQLAPEKIDDALCDLRARRFETLHHEPGTCYEYKKSVLREEITRHTLLRAVYSRRQLFEVMVGFWTDHLNINLEKGDSIYLKPSDDRTVIRAHALGKFRDLIRASAISPAMLVYLDGKENRKAGPADIPNENYARELLELHTLGVGGGYTQADVYEVARCLTGWRLRTKWRKGTVYFEPAWHDDGEKTVLGYRIPAGGGERDLDRVVEIVCNHPSTARHIATKLAQKLASEQPPVTLVDRVAKVFTETGGDIKAMLREVLHSGEFKTSRGVKFKRPFHFIASCLRATGADTHAHKPLIEYLLRMGQAPFQHPTPDGYPDEAAPWLGTLLWRWNFALAIAANQIPSVNVEPHRLINAIGGSDPAQLLPHFIGRAGTKAELKALNDYAASQGIDTNQRKAETLGLILASPAFQKC
ncbi:MAG TPA: DUF1800 domain-containing protein [Blastocatellia bacterium]|nr:DUF1800 domain-containing protein [Blastocatellia bacterium]